MTLLDDLAAAWRAVRRAPHFTAVAALTLALGIGATTTLVSVLDSLLIRPPEAVEQPERVVRSYFRFSSQQFGGWTNSSVSYPDLTDLSRSPAFSKVAGLWMNQASIGRGADARPLNLALVAGDYFGLYGTRPLLGRLLTAEDEKPDNGSPAVVLSEAMWRTRFGADSGIVGRTLPIDAQVYTVAGVAARGFDGGDVLSPDAWAPLGGVRDRLGGNYQADRNWYFINILARLAPGVTRTQAAAQATAIIAAARSDSAVSNGFREVLLGPVQELRGPDYSQDARLTLWLAAMSAVVLLIACANVANLLLARGLVRAREFAIRKSLGARQGRVVRQLVLEGLLVSLLSGVAGLLVCAWGGDLLRGYLLSGTQADRFTLDHRVYLIALAATVAAALLSSVVPAMQVVRGDLTPMLKEGARGGGFHRSRLRAGLVVLQIALSLILVAGAGLFVRSLRKVLAIDIGYDRDRVVMVSVDPARAGFTGSAIGAAFETMADAARRNPGVESVALTFGEPFGWSMSRGLRIAGHDSLPRLSSGGPYIQSVTADYFRTMGLSILRGHGFTEQDRREAPAVALIGATMAKRFFPGADPLGQCLLIGDGKSCTTIVGVVKDGIRYSPQEEEQALYYVPLPPVSSTTNHLTLFVRTRAGADRLAGELHRELQTALPNLPYVETRSLEEVLAPSYRSWRLGATLFGLYAVTALLLASIGIYSVLAYAVRGRTHELGIRVALGAEPSALLAMVMGDGLRLALLGIGLGLGTALVAGRALGALLYGVSPGDPLTMTLAGAVLLLVAVAASFLPARRATRVSPMVALRSE
jgi:predicted permease